MTATDAVILARDVTLRRALKPVQGALAILRGMARRHRAVEVEARRFGLATRTEEGHAALAAAFETAAAEIRRALKAARRA